MSELKTRKSDYRNPFDDSLVDGGDDNDTFDVRLDGGASVGFDAAEYTFNGETIIAYRGTDFKTTIFNLPLSSAFARDVLAGWTSSFNIFGASEATSASVGGAVLVFSRSANSCLPVAISVVSC